MINSCKTYLANSLKIISAMIPNILNFLYARVFAVFMVINSIYFFIKFFMTALWLHSWYVYCGINAGL